MYVICGSLMFWTDWNREAPKIEKANMDGTDRQSVVTEGLGLPNGLTIDYHSSQLCWADAGKSRPACLGVVFEHVLLRLR